MGAVGDTMHNASHSTIKIYIFLGSLFILMLLVDFFEEPSWMNVVICLFFLAIMFRIYRLYVDLERQKSDLLDHRMLDRFIFNSIDYLVIAIDMNREITIFNNKAKEMFGIQSDAVVGKRYEEVFFSKLARQDRRLLHSLEAGASYNLPAHPVEIGSKKYLLDIYITPLKDDRGQMAGAVGLYRDVTQQKLLEAEMEQKDKMSIIGQMAAGTVHEIRNPLATAKGHLDLAISKLNEPSAEIERHLNIIRKQLDRANYTLSGLLALAKPKPSVTERVDIQDLIDDAMEWAYYSAVAGSIQLNAEEYPEEIFVDVDPEKIKQILINLLYNAFDATPPGGKVEVWAERDPKKPFVAICVNDTGVGMTEEQIANVGRPFFTTKESGTGLGLLVSRQIAESHGGYIDICSELGKGTTFKVWLPLPTYTA